MNRFPPPPPGAERRQHARHDVVVSVEVAHDDTIAIASLTNISHGGAFLEIDDCEAIEPTGVGDAFRAGFLAALAWGVSLERAAQVGCVLAAYVVETVGTQEYTFTHSQFAARLGRVYGEDSGREVAALLT